MKSIIAVLSLGILFSSTSAFANGYLRMDFLYQTDASGMEGATGDTKRTLLDLGGGYVQESKGWAVGALYATDKTSSGSGEADRTAMGPMFGWVSQKDNGAYVFGTYFLSANLTGGYTGNGYQFDVGYKFAVRKVSFGAQLSKKHITFDKLNGQSISPKYVEDKIDPYVVMFIDF